MSRRNSVHDDPSIEGVYEAMEPLEPYTTGQLAEELNTSKDSIWSPLRKLAIKGKVRKKVPKPNLRIWIREAPSYECPNCDYQFQIKHLHPVLSSIRICPRCGTQLN